MRGYLAVALDDYSRLVIGSALERTLEAKLAVGALRMALNRRGGPAGLIHIKAQADTRSIVPSDFRRMLTRWARNCTNHLLRNAAANSQFSDFELPRLRRDLGGEY